MTTTKDSGIAMTKDSRIARAKDWLTPWMAATTSSSSERQFGMTGSGSAMTSSRVSGTGLINDSDGDEEDGCDRLVDVCWDGLATAKSKAVGMSSSMVRVLGLQQDHAELCDGQRNRTLGEESRPHVLR